MACKVKYDLNRCRLKVRFPEHVSDTKYLGCVFDESKFNSKCEGRVNGNNVRSQLDIYQLPIIETDYYVLKQEFNANLEVYL